MGNPQFCSGKSSVLQLLPQDPEKAIEKAEVNLAIENRRSLPKIDRKILWGWKMLDGSPFVRDLDGFSLNMFSYVFLCATLTVDLRLANQGIKGRGGRLFIKVVSKH